MSHCVFISYSTSDEDVALRVRATLERAGIGCWIAPTGIDYGDVWAASIVNAIRDAQVVVVVVSGSANKSLWVPREVHCAVKYNRPIIPVRTAPVLLSDELGFFLDITHWFDWVTGNEAEFVAAMNRILGGTPGASDPQAKPRPVSDEAAKRAFLRTWCAQLAALRDSGAISETDFENVWRHVLPLSNSGARGSLEDIDTLAADLQARGRTLIEASAMEIVDAPVDWGAPAVIARVLYSIRSTLPLCCEHFGTRFVLLPPGSCRHNPRNNLLINRRPFYLSESLVDEACWANVADVPDPDSRTDRAKTNVSLTEAQVWVEKANRRLPAGYRVALPTIDQWEYAFALGCNHTTVALNHAWLRRSPASPIGLSDMVGVARQFCGVDDNWQFRGSGYLDPGPAEGREPTAEVCNNSGFKRSYLGVRLVLSAELSRTTIG